MNATDLMSDTPRAADVVESYTRDCAERTKKFARGLSLCFVLTAVLMSGVFMVGIASLDFEYAVWASLLSLLILGGLTSFVLSWMILGDVRTAKRLVREGTAYRGTIVRDFCLSYRTLHIIDVAWEGDGRRDVARFTIPEIELTGNVDVTVLALPRGHQIAAAFGDRGVFIGRRTR